MLTLPTRTSLSRVGPFLVSLSLPPPSSQVELEQQGDAEVLADQCFVDARKMVDDVAPLVTIAVRQEQDKRDRNRHMTTSRKGELAHCARFSASDSLFRPTSTRSAASRSQSSVAAR